MVRTHRVGSVSYNTFLGGDPGPCDIESGERSKQEPPEALALQLLEDARKSRAESSDAQDQCHRRPKEDVGRPTYAPSGKKACQCAQDAKQR